ncbi:MAG: DUF2156 domain-containing protein [Bacteroidales bacterium]|nr:DUF2156 domain-containing protein [Bacteroidales bacterium]
MLSFRRISIDAVEVFKRFFPLRTSLNAGNSFTNLCAYDFIYPAEYVVYGDTLLTRIHLKKDEHICYYQPVNGNIEDFSEEIERQAQEQKQVLSIIVESRELADRFVSKGYRAEYSETLSEYVYKRENLECLKGKRLQAKRNHINKFVSLYPDWQYVSLSSADKDECLELNSLWLQQELLQIPQYEKDYLIESRVIEYLFDNFEALNLIGGAIKTGGKMIAYSLGSVICRNTFDTNIEKADRNYEGAYTIINREIAKHLNSDILFINREEDKGIAGLRKAKQSYHPEFMVEKYIVSKEF